MPDFERAREDMVRRQIAARGLCRPDLLRAFHEVPREQFVPPRFAAQAYEDGPLPIEAGQTISQPYIVALMIDAAGIGPGDRVLEIGAGSGYAAAILGWLAASVVTLERHAELAQLASERLGRLGYNNVEVVLADGTTGWIPGAPYDAILVAASGSHIPHVLLDQLAPGGRLVMPVGAADGVQRLLKATRVAPDRYSEEDLGPVRFVPLIGRHGWQQP